MDQLAPEARSELMRRIRERNTGPEKVVRSIARRLVGYFRSNAKSLPGKPDLAMFGVRRAIFVHGCFWHQHPNCSRSNVPKSNKSYWVPKLKRNVQRDRENARALRQRGWKVLVVWECQCRETEFVERRLKNFFRVGPQRRRVKVTLEQRRPQNRRRSPR
jgi:DNA mismatch endonuclease (patch repair protein)